MKKLFVLLGPVLLGLLVLYGGSNDIEKNVKSTDLQKKDGLFYKKNEKKPFSGKEVNYYKNGKKKGEVNYKNGKPFGNIITWYDNGQKQSEGYYKDGKANGKAIAWYKTGQKLGEVNRIDGKAHGKVISWYKNGRKKFEGYFKDGKEHGKVIKWAENGKIVAEETYKDGIKNLVTDKDQQKRTMEDIKQIYFGILMHKTKFGFAPDFSGTAKELYLLLPSLKKNASGDLRATKDGWGNDIIIISNRAKDTHSVASSGKDGKFKGWNQVGKYSKNDYDQDIIYTDGKYTYSPK